MNETTPLWALAANAFLGVALIAWTFASFGPFLFGYPPLLPGMEVAFVLMCAWAGWNAHLILRGEK